MKIIYTFVVALFVLATAAQAQDLPTLPIDFESTTTTYAFADFAGGVGNVVTNPSQTGINTSETVGSVVKFAGEPFGGTTIALAGNIDFGTNNAFSMKVFSNAPGQSVLFKLEGSPAVEFSMNTTVANEWETLTFSAASAVGLDFNAITLIYRNGEVGDGSADFTFLFDDIELTTIAPMGVAIPVDFESTTLTYSFGDFAGGVGSVIANPAQTGINTSANVGQVIKFAGEPFGGTTLALGVPTDFGSNNGIRMKVFANRVDAPILFKLEGAVPTEEVARTTVANEWHEVEFNFSGRTDASYTGITLIYDNGVVGDGSADFTFLLDDIEYATISGPVVGLPVDFESADLTYTFADFAGAGAMVIDNPVPSGINTSARVGQMIKFGGEVFAGTTLQLGEPIEFGAETAITMKMFANRVGAPMLFKLEDGGAGIEIAASSTVANEWETLTFDFAGLIGSGPYTGITLIYDLGIVGDGSADFTVLFDDMQFAGSSSTTDLRDLGVSFFPNPVTTSLTIQSSAELSTVEVFNLNGQRVILNEAMTNNTLSTAGLPQGTYVLRVTTAEGVGTSTFVKQ